MCKSLLQVLPLIVLANVAPQGSAGADDAYGSNVQIAFPNDTVSSFVVRRRPAIWELDPERTIAEQLPQLLLAAERGDGSAADSVAQLLQYCADAYTTTTELESAVNLLNQTGRFSRAGPNARVYRIPDQDSRRIHAEELREQYRLCLDVTAHDISAAGRWRETAMRSGHILASLDYAGSLGITEGGLAAWRATWMAGSLPALHSIGTLLARGVQPMTDGTPDFVEAYANKLLHLLLQKAITPDAQSQSRRTFLAHLQTDLDRIGGSLKPAQWNAAAKRAKELLDTNPACCIVH